MTKDDCKLCDQNNHGWCKKYNLQLPKAVIECEAAKAAEHIDIKTKKVKKAKIGGNQFTKEELNIIVRALRVYDEFYYENEIRDKEYIINNNDDEEEAKKNNPVIIDAYTVLLDTYIAEQEKLHNIIDKIDKEIN